VSCDEYERKKVLHEVSLKRNESQQSGAKRYLDDKALLEKLMAQEKMADFLQVVTPDSPTSD
jgi:hypothetical protein